MAENYTPTGATAAAIERFTAAEAATGTFGTMMRTFHTEIADRTRFLATTGLIAFPATQVTSADANTLDDYEEGTWTPTDASGAGLTFAVALGSYEKIGRHVVARGAVTFPATADGTAASIGGLPFTNGSGVDAGQAFIGNTSETTCQNALPASSGTTVSPRTNADATITNATLSGDYIRFTVIFRIA